MSGGGVFPSENSTWPADVQRSAAARRMKSVGVPPAVGTLKDDHSADEVVKTIREPSGVNTGAIFGVPSLVNAADAVTRASMPPT